MFRLISAALAIAAALVFAAPASAAQSACPIGNYSNDPGPEALNVPLDTYVLPAGKPFCAWGKAPYGTPSPTTGLLVADGITTLGDYVRAAGITTGVMMFSTYQPARVCAFSECPAPSFVPLPATDTEALPMTDRLLALPPALFALAIEAACLAAIAAAGATLYLVCEAIR